MRPFALVTFSLLTNLVSNVSYPADICDNLSFSDRLMMWGQPAAKVMMDFDQASHSICYSFTPMVKDMNVVPDHICVNISDAVAQPLKLRFNDGKEYDITEVYNPERTLEYYNFYLKKCLSEGVHI